VAAAVENQAEMPVSHAKAFRRIGIVHAAGAGLANSIEDAELGDESSPERVRNLVRVALRAVFVDADERRGNRVLEHKLIQSGGFEHHGVLVERTDSA